MLARDGRRHNFQSLVDPTPADDETFGWSVGSFIYRPATTTLFVCVDASAGIADWQVVVGATTVPALRTISVYDTTIGPLYFIVMLAQAIVSLDVATPSVYDGAVIV